MIICRTKEELQQALENKKSIGYVPTMGALHEGHLSLMRRAKFENELACASIFVNPIQFTNPDDLKHYPRNLEKDMQLLEEAGCDVLFVPEEKEMYPTPAVESYAFGLMEEVMEGEFRPGHFNGVAVVVKRFFDLFHPQKAYFGEKDYQQLQIIRKLVEQLELPTEIVACQIVRENDGLAMSSRNALLSPEARKIAPLLYKTLKDAKQMSSVLDVVGLKAWVASQLGRASSIQLDYFEITDAETLQPIKNWDDASSKRAFIAATIENVRLIDNIVW